MDEKKRQEIKRRVEDDRKKRLTPDCPFTNGEILEISFQWGVGNKVDDLQVILLQSQILGVLGQRLKAGDPFTASLCATMTKEWILDYLNRAIWMFRNVTLEGVVEDFQGTMNGVMPRLLKPEKPQ